MQSHKKCFLLPVLSVITMALAAQNNNPQQYHQDFDYFWKTIKTDYCYWDKKQIDWDKVREIYMPFFDTVSSRRSFVLLLEKVFNEIYDHHASLNTNTKESQRLVPTGADIWAEYLNDRPLITEIRRGSGAEKAGLKAGMEIDSVNGHPVSSLVQSFMPKALLPNASKEQYNEARNYALREILAGIHSEQRIISTLYQNKQQQFYPDQPVNLLETQEQHPAVESRRINKDIGYIRINNELGNNEVIPLFDSVLHLLLDTRALILDLRETPSGGNTTVARSIIGHFISKEGFYQKHELTAEEREFGVKRSWEEIVSPRKPLYTKPLVILVDHWTGSIAEGITIGFDGLHRAAIIGTRMAGLNGAVYSYVMPHTGIGFSFPVEKLFHINGTPREKFIPAILVNTSTSETGDPILNRAIQYIHTLSSKNSR